MNLGTLAPCCLVCGRALHDGPCPPPAPPAHEDSGRPIREGAPWAFVVALVVMLAVSIAGCWIGRS